MIFRSITTLGCWIIKQTVVVWVVSWSILSLSLTLTFTLWHEFLFPFVFCSCSLQIHFVCCLATFFLLLLPLISHPHDLTYLLFPFLPSFFLCSLCLNLCSHNPVPPPSLSCLLSYMKIVDHTGCYHSIIVNWHWSEPLELVDLFTFLALHIPYPLT